jgi:ADP-Ribosyltransferase in polyvalent proteins
MKDAKGHGSDPRGTHAQKIASLPKWVGIGYHGTASNFDKFEANEPVTITGNKDMKGIYFSGDERSAWGYANMAGRRPGAGQRQVVAANLTMSNPLDITNMIKNGQRRGLSFGDAKRAALKNVTPEHDGVIFRGNSVNPPEYIVFRHDQVTRIKR